TVASVLAVGAMVGLPPTLGFVAKEGALTALLHEAMGGAVWGWVALVGMILGSILTTAYGVRFVWGAFASKKDAEGKPLPATEWPDPPIWFISAPAILATLSLLGGLAAPLLDPALQLFAATAPAASPG